MEDNGYKKMIIHRIFSILKKNDIYDIIINKLLKASNPLYHNYITLNDLMVQILRYYRGSCYSRPKVYSYFFPFIYWLFNCQLINEIELLGDIYNSEAFWKDDILYNWYIEHVEKE